MARYQDYPEWVEVVRERGLVGATFAEHLIDAGYTSPYDLGEGSEVVIHGLDVDGDGETEWWVTVDGRRVTPFFHDEDNPEVWDAYRFWQTWGDAPAEKDIDTPGGKRK